ncbi:MAG: cellulose biosynthesis protein BcsD [Janthinobacterium lividum]
MTDSATPDFTLLLHALASEFDAQAGTEARDKLLHAVGRRMAERIAPPPCDAVEALEIEINDLLASIGWGRMHFDVRPDEQALLITHENLPRLGALGDPPGQWLAATLEGLYETWLSRQPGATDTYVASREPNHNGMSTPGTVVLRLRSVSA